MLSAKIAAVEDIRGRPNVQSNMLPPFIAGAVYRYPRGSTESFGYIYHSIYHDAIIKPNLNLR